MTPIAAALILASSPVPPVATPPLPSHTGVCVWNEISQAGRNRMLASYKAHFNIHIERSQPRNAELEPAIARCLGTVVASDAEVGFAETVFQAHAIEEGAAKVLLEDYGVTRDHLDAAWLGLTPEGRETVRRTALAFAMGGEPDFTAELVQAQKFGAALGFGDDSELAARRHVSTYLVARSIDWVEPR